MKHEVPHIDDQTIAKIAARADVDPRTVIRRVAGLPVKGRPGVRVDRAIAEVMAKGTTPSP